MDDYTRKLVNHLQELARMARKGGTIVVAQVLLRDTASKIKELSRRVEELEKARSEGIRKGVGIGSEGRKPR